MVNVGPIISLVIFIGIVVGAIVWRMLQRRKEVQNTIIVEPIDDGVIMPVTDPKRTDEYFAQEDEERLKQEQLDRAQRVEDARKLVEMEEQINESVEEETEG